MKRRNLVATGVSVTATALRTKNFGGWGNADRPEIVPTIRRAIDAGTDVIDTADVCQDGETEGILTKALEPRIGA